MTGNLDRLVDHEVFTLLEIFAFSTALGVVSWEEAPTLKLVLDQLTMALVVQA